MKFLTHEHLNSKRLNPAVPKYQIQIKETSTEPAQRERAFFMDSKYVYLV